MGEDWPEAPSGILLEYTQDKVALVDDEGEYGYVNEAARRILGFEPDDLVGTIAFDYIHPDDVERVREKFDRVITSDDFVEGTVEYRHRRADGSWAWLESRMSNLTDDELEGYVVSSRDISDQKAAESDRDATAARLRELSAVAGEVLWMFDADWEELLFINPAYEDIYGGSVDELADDPTSFLDAIHPDDVEAVRDAMACLSAGNPVDMEYRVNPSTDYQRWVWVQGEPIVEDGEVVRITGFTRDVTDRTSRERQLTVMDNLLRHNLRNDLNVISGVASDLEGEFPEAADRTAVIRERADELLESASKQREVLELLRSPSHVEWLDLVDLVESAAATVRERFPNADVRLTLPESASVRAIPELQAVVVELLENAVRHNGSPNPRVDVELSGTDARTELVVSDYCEPIPEIEADVLRGEHETSDVYHSSGLGFWLTYWTMNLSGGSVRVCPGDTRGNRIALELQG